MDDLQRDKRKGIPIPYPSNVSVPHSKPQFRKMDILAGPHNHVHVNERKVADQESSRRLTNGGYLNAVMNSVPIAVGNSRKVGNLKPAPKFNGQNAFGFSASRCPPITSSQNRSEYFPVNGRSSEKRPIPATVQLSDDEIQESTVKSATVDSGPDFIFQKPAKVEKGFETILVWDGTRLISRQGFLRFSSAGIQIEIQNREVINLSVKSLMGDRPCCKVASLQSPELKTPHQVVAFRWKTGGSTTNDFTIVLHERHNQEEVTSSIFPFQILELDGHIVAQVFERWDRLTQLTASTRSTRRVEVNRPNSFYGGDSYQPEIRSLRDESFERRRSKRVNRGISYKEEIHSEENKRIPTIPLPLTNNEYSL